MKETPPESGTGDTPAEDGGVTEQSVPEADPAGETGSGSDDRSESVAGDESVDGYDYMELDGSLSMEEAVSILGEETRARILFELGEDFREDAIAPDALSFSELMDRVGAEDSGRLNYHLEKLVGTYVHKIDAGYRLSLPGHFFYRSIVSGKLTTREPVESFEAGPCPDCGESMVADYSADGLFLVRCPGCDTVHHSVALPASGLEERTPREALAAAIRKHMHEVALLRQGVCHSCGGAVERRLDDGDDYDFLDLFAGDGIYAVMQCSVCGASHFGPPFTAALVTSSAIAFFDEHGRDAFGAVAWDESMRFAMANTTVHDGGDRVTVPFELDGDCLTLTLDDDLAVVATDRE